MKNPYGLSLVKANATNGVIDLAPNISQSYRIEVSDLPKTKQRLLVPIDYAVRRHNSRRTRYDALPGQSQHR
jgi:hypothetical protein